MSVRYTIRYLCDRCPAELSRAATMEQLQEAEGKLPDGWASFSLTPFPRNATVGNTDGDVDRFADICRECVGALKAEVNVRHYMEDVSPKRKRKEVK